MYIPHRLFSLDHTQRFDRVKHQYNINIFIKFTFEGMSSKDSVELHSELALLRGARLGFLENFAKSWSNLAFLSPSSDGTKN